MQKLKVLDLFSGIGGFSLGLESTGGFETVAFCEIDKPCQRILRKHWADASIFDDVTVLKAGNLIDSGRKFLIFEDNFCSHTVVTDVDVICGGFPCQDISTANVTGQGLEGERSGLWKEFKRLIKEIKPRYAIIENVANLRNKGLTTVLQDLRKIGYDAEWHIIPASALGGYHRRERLWIIAYPNRERSEHSGESFGASTKKSSTLSFSNGEPTPNTDYLRFRLSLASKEEKRKWWSEVSARFSGVLRKIFEVEPTVRRGNDGLSKRLDKDRKERIKQLGNAVVPQIPQLIGEAILEYERRQLHGSNFDVPTKISDSQ